MMVMVMMSIYSGVMSDDCVIKKKDAHMNAVAV